MGAYYDRKTGKYKTAKGKEIPARPAVDAVTSDTKERLRKVAAKHIDNKLNFAAWATESEELIRKALIAAGQIGAGGKAQMTAKQNGRLGARVRFHVEKFREFGLARERGEVTDAQFLARAEMYGEAVKTTYEQLRQSTLADDGFTEAKRLLGAAKHCEDCPPLAGKWVPIADLVPIGDSACLTRCRCSVEYR